MRKITLLFVSLLFVFISCSKDSPETAAEPTFTNNGTLLKRSISTNGSNVTTSDFFYIGNKLQKMVSSNGTRIEYSYTGNLITQTLYFESDVLKEKSEIQYNSEEKMIQRKSSDYSNNKGYRCEFTYSNDGTVTVLGFSGDFTTQNTQIVNRKVFLFANGDVEKIEAYVVVNGSNQTRTNYYTYDDKNAISNSILGYNKIKFWDTGTYGNSHNNISILYTSTENISPYPYTNDVVFTYNSYNYPITSSAYGNSLTSQYFYQ
ncbi:hypothetical protein SAMN05660845_0403 [Flavobacterium swingsii]|uniref:YD repeat-containing protein n=1 Tax=Flavobacterium swingsii TaxID=498292 RepID=A0A1I0VHW9_9FLAO|nr:hypothetical protein [Flavobacterium swingsii]SFA75921.1 hypothetical protein SAMN05660845_0403 [Flavobacterium swingsii]